MLKFITLLARKPGLSHEDFCRYWREEHGHLAMRIMPRMVRYVQNQVVAHPGGGQPPFDGVAEVWFDGSWDDLYAWYTSEAGRQLREDEAKFIDTSRWITLIVEETVMKG